MDSSEQLLSRVTNLETSVNRHNNIVYVVVTLWVILAGLAGYAVKTFTTLSSKVEAFEQQVASGKESFTKHVTSLQEKAKLNIAALVKPQLGQPGMILQVVTVRMSDNFLGVWGNPEEKTAGKEKPGKHGSEFVPVAQISITPKSKKSKLVVSAIGSMTIQSRKDSSYPHIGGAVELVARENKIAGTSFYATDVNPGPGSYRTRATPFVVEGEFIPGDTNPVTFYLRLRQGFGTNVQLNFSHPQGAFGPGLLKVVEVAG